MAGIGQASCNRRAQGRRIITIRPRIVSHVSNTTLSDHHRYHPRWDFLIWSSTRLMVTSFPPLRRRRSKKKKRYFLSVNLCRYHPSAIQKIADENHLGFAPKKSTFLPKRFLITDQSLDNADVCCKLWRRINDSFSIKTRVDKSTTANHFVNLLAFHLTGDISFSRCPLIYRWAEE